MNKGVHAEKGRAGTTIDLRKENSVMTDTLQPPRLAASSGHRHCQGQLRGSAAGWAAPVWPRASAMWPPGLTALSGWLAAGRGAGRVWRCKKPQARYGEALAFHLTQQGRHRLGRQPAAHQGYGESQLRQAKTDRGDAASGSAFGLATRCPAGRLHPNNNNTATWCVVYADHQQMRQQERNPPGGGTLFVVRGRQPTNRPGRAGGADSGSLQQAIQNTCASLPGLAAHLPAVDLHSRHWLHDRHLADGRTARHPGLHHAQATRRLRRPGSGCAHQSGTSVHRRAHTSRKGNAVLRAQLFMSASLSAHVRISGPCSSACSAPAKPKWSSSSPPCASCIHLVYGILKSGRPFDPVLALSPGPGA